MVQWDNSQYFYYKEIIKDRKMPLAFVDLDAFEHNIKYIVSTQAGNGKTIRVASKSLRCVDLMKRIFELGGDAVRGIMSFTPSEARFLVEHDFDDILLAYPSVQSADMQIMVDLKKKGKKVYLMVDNIEQLKIMSDAGEQAGVVLDACLDVDMSFRPFETSLHLGVRRSPIRTPQDAVALAGQAGKLSGVRIKAFMGYEAQIAGLQDDSPFTRAMNPAIKLIKKYSIRDVAERRSAVVKALEGVGITFDLVNGGGSGSLLSTGAEDVVTEVAAGSGFYCSLLFQHYRAVHFEPAAFFALQIVRKPVENMVTCHGGGYVASGSAGQDKQPQPVLPAGLATIGAEGVGEVQTPLSVPAGTPPLKLGDPVIFQHAKAGELCERFNELLLISKGEIVGTALTYRGQGRAFL